MFEEGQRLRRHLRDDDGQTSAEYLGVLVVIAVIVGALVIANPGVGGTLRDAIRATICAIGGGSACDAVQANPWEPTAPCVLSRAGGEGSAELHIAVVDLGGGKGFTVEERSDGTFAVTMYENGEIGLSTGVGGGLSVSTGGSSTGGKVEARTGGKATRQNGRTEVFDNADDAAQFVQDQLVSAGIDTLPPGVKQPVQLGRWVIDKVTGHETPSGTEESTHSTTGLEVNAKAEAGTPLVGGITEATVSGAYERKEDARSGDVSYSFDLSSSVIADAEIARGVTLGVGADGAITATLTLDANGNPKEFSVTSSIGGRLDLDLLHEVSDVTDLLKHLELTADHTASSSIETTYTLDLTRDPRHAGTVQSFLDSVGSADLGGAREHGADLLRAMRTDSMVSVATYDHGEAEYGAEGRVRKVIGLGAGVKVQISESNLTGASFLDRDQGRMVPRESCTV